MDGLIFGLSWFIFGLIIIIDQTVLQLISNGEIIIDY